MGQALKLILGFVQRLDLLDHGGEIGEFLGELGVLGLADAGIELVLNERPALDEPLEFFNR